MQPLLRARSYAALLQSLRELPPTEELARPWRLRYETHTAGPAAAGEPRAHAFLSGCARFLHGPPALLAPGSAHRVDLVLLRSRRLWYLCREDRDGARHGLGTGLGSPWTPSRQGEGADKVWSSRPYTFSAATDPALARLALSVALAVHRRAAPDACTGALDPSMGVPVLKVLDPCCGSGTVLYAAAQRGLGSIGLDLNPLASDGARRNLRYASDAFGWPVSTRPAVIEHDSTLPLPADAVGGVGLVVASLPWGREQRIPRAGYVEEVIGCVARHLPDATIATLTAEPIGAAMAGCGLAVHAQAEVGVRCVLAVARRAPPAGRAAGDV